MLSDLCKGVSAPSPHWNDLLIRRLFRPGLTQGEAHLAVWSLSRRSSTTTPGTAAGIISSRHPEQRPACALATQTLLLAHASQRPLDSPVQYLGALWEFQGSLALLEALVTLPEELAEAIAADLALSRVRDDESPRLRIRRAAIDAWHLAEFGDTPVFVN